MWRESAQKTCTLIQCYFVLGCRYKVDGISRCYSRAFAASFITSSIILRGARRCSSSGKNTDKKDGVKSKKLKEQADEIETVIKQKKQRLETTIPNFGPEECKLSKIHLYISSTNFWFVAVADGLSAPINVHKPSTIAGKLKGPIRHVQRMLVYA